MFETECRDRRSHTQTEIQGFHCKVSSSTEGMLLKLLILTQSYSLVLLMALSNSPILRILFSIL